MHVAYLKDLIEIMIKNDKFHFYFIKCAKLFWHLPPSPTSPSSSPLYAAATANTHSYIERNCRRQIEALNKTTDNNGSSSSNNTATQTKLNNQNINHFKIIFNTFYQQQPLAKCINV